MLFFAWMYSTCMEDMVNMYINASLNRMYEVLENEEPRQRPNYWVGDPETMGCYGGLGTNFRQALRSYFWARKGKSCSKMFGCLVLECNKGSSLTRVEEFGALKDGPRQEHLLSILIRQHFQSLDEGGSCCWCKSGEAATTARHRWGRGMSGQLGVCLVGWLILFFILCSAFYLQYPCLPIPSHLIYTVFPVCLPCCCLLCLFCLSVFSLLFLYSVWRPSPLSRLSNPLSYHSHLPINHIYPYLSYQSHHALSILLISSSYWSVHIVCCFAHCIIALQILQLASRPSALSWVEKRTWKFRRSTRRHRPKRDMFMQRGNRLQAATRCHWLELELVKTWQIHRIRIFVSILGFCASCLNRTFVGALPVSQTRRIWAENFRVIILVGVVLGLFFCCVPVNLYWLVLSDEQMSKGWLFSLLNDEQMSNWLGVEHRPVYDMNDSCVSWLFFHSKRQPHSDTPTPDNDRKYKPMSREEEHLIFAIHTINPLQWSNLKSMIQWFIISLEIHWSRRQVLSQSGSFEGCRPPFSWRFRSGSRGNLGFVALD